MEPLVVRTATLDDKDTVVNVRKIGAERAFAGSANLPDVYAALVNERANPDKFDREMSDENCTVLVAESNGAIVGTALLAVADNAGELSATAATVPDQGIGSALMAARIELAQQRGLEKVWLETDTINPGGIAHAERHNFVQVAKRPGKTVPGNFVITYERTLEGSQ